MGGRYARRACALHTHTHTHTHTPPVHTPCSCAQVSRAEVACLASHAAAWRAAERADLDWVVVVEDDVAPHSGGGWGGQGGGGGSVQSYAQLWARVWWRLSTEVEALEAAVLQPVGSGEGGGSAAAAGAAWDLLYLGRNRLGPDSAAVGARLVVPGFSSCAHAYVLSRRGYRRLLRLLPRVAEAALPVDELLPALCTAHPREDVAAWAARLLRWEAAQAAKPAKPAEGVHEIGAAGAAEGAGASRPRVLSAFAFRVDLVWQLEAIATGALTSCPRPRPQLHPRFHPCPQPHPRPHLPPHSQPSPLPSPPAEPSC